MRGDSTFSGTTHRSLLAGAWFDFQRACDFEAIFRLSDAVECYRRAIRAQSGFTEARLGLARCLANLGHIPEAVEAYKTLARREPRNESAWRGLCWLQGNLRDFVGASASISKLSSLGADVAHELAELGMGLMHTCDWSTLSSVRSRLIKRFNDGQPCFVDPYVLLAMEDSPKHHLNMARCIAGAIKSGISELPVPRSRTIDSDNRRLRIGYLCGDLNKHATPLLMSGVIESHNRSLFHCFAFDYSINDNSPERKRITSAFEDVVRLGSSSPAEDAAQIEAHKIDILIDLKGYTRGTRTELLALRPAPIQANFLGYVGTQGGDWIDYVIADRHVLPVAEQSNWHEEIVHLPNSYYPSDRTRPFPALPNPEKRLTYGLPPSGFVFVCFNNSYKITPAIFKLWAELLHSVPSSVLWLYADNDFVAANLRLEASRAGLDAGRLVFGGPMPLQEHINRYAYADLFLDTCPYGAHTTGVDALWAGVPLLTLTGVSFASRVGSSLLEAVRLPELICRTSRDYVSKAIHLVNNPQCLLQLRQHLISARLTSSLFDAQRFAIDLERVYTTMAALSREGRRPEYISL